MGGGGGEDERAEGEGGGALGYRHPCKSTRARCGGAGCEGQEAYNIFVGGLASCCFGRGGKWAGTREYLMLDRGGQCAR